MEEIYIFTTMHKAVGPEEAERCRKLIERLKEKNIANRTQKTRKHKKTE